MAWLPTHPIPLLWIYQQDFEMVKAQEEMLYHLQKGNPSLAGEIYQRKIFPKITALLKGMENMLKYNGWALRWLAMLKKWEKERDEKTLDELLHELEMVKWQADLCIESPRVKKQFFHLILYISKRLKLREFRKD